MMVFGFAYRDDAAVSDFALDMLELDGGVNDVEVVLQNFFHIAQDALTH